MGAIEDVNVIISTYTDSLMGDVQVAPEKGTVAFGSGLHGWGFNVERFVAALRQQTSGQAFPQCVFDHWDNMPGNCMEEGKMQELALNVRKRKNIKVAMPALGEYLDKL